MTDKSELKAETQLKREVGLFGAVLLGLGSIVGTGVFVSIAIGAGSTGPSVLLAIFLAGIVAAANGLSSAQLAAAFPVSGGTYEYAYRLLNPSLGFTAGWMFLCAKSASAATAALGLAGAICQQLDVESPEARLLIAVCIVFLLTAITVSGVRRTNMTNAILVTFTLATLLAFVVAGFGSASERVEKTFWPFFAPTSGDSSAWGGFLQASALMFVAFTGYGRIATMAEEVREPHKTIPIAIIITLIVSMLIYVTVGFVGVGALGASQFAAAGASQFAPLQVVAQSLELPRVASLLLLGAITAMLSVCLNLILGLSRVALAMARRNDIPSYFEALNTSKGSPIRSIWFVASIILVLVLIGNVRTTWSFSAFTVLIYYAITNLTAIRLPKEQRLYPVSIAWFGLVGCLGLAFWVDREIWVAGMALILIGLIWHRLGSLVLGEKKLD